MKNEIKSTTFAFTLILLTATAWAGPGEIGSATEEQAKILCSQKLPEFKNARIAEVSKGVDAMARSILADAYRNADLKINSITLVDTKETKMFYHIDAGQDSINVVAVYTLPIQGTYDLFSAERYTQFDNLGRRAPSQGIQCVGTDRTGISGYTVQVYNSDTNRLIGRDSTVLNKGVEILIPDTK